MVKQKQKSKLHIHESNASFGGRKVGAIRPRHHNPTGQPRTAQTHLAESNRHQQRKNRSRTRRNDPMLPARHILTASCRSARNIGPRHSRNKHKGFKGFRIFTLTRRSLQYHTQILIALRMEHPCSNQ
jgi:hypothetical protein